MTCVSGLDPSDTCVSGLDPSDGGKTGGNTQSQIFEHREDTEK
jgi:hypothetical protein